MTNDKIIEIADSLDWSAKIGKNEYSFETFSPAGKNFYIEFSSPDIETLKKDLADFIDNFDVSYEAYMWLDDWGHGINGAPYDMKDVYEDTERCLNAVLELYRELFAN